MPDLPECLKDSKCIIHIDLDCFYSQVEEVRLGLDSSKPVAVQQWENLIAVNYAARAFGVNRLCSVEEAKRLCPEITLVHVPTYARNETQPQYHPNPSITTHKTALDVYHNAGKQIFKIFKQHCQLLQKLGSDEAFMDVTTQVNERLCQEFIPAHSTLVDANGNAVARADDFVLDWTSVNHVLPSADEIEQHGMDTTITGSPSYRDPTTWFDIQLFVASQLAANIRKNVFDELHYTCSAGIAHNKVLAKLGSSRNKPNKQTIIRQHVASHFMKDIPFKKIRKLGGKFGQAVESRYYIQTAGDLWQYPLEELQRHFGSTYGSWLYNIVRGIDDEEVILIKAPKSLVASKNLRPALLNEKELIPWYAVLCGELHARVMRNWNEHQTWPNTLYISYKNANHATSRSRSKSIVNKSDFVTPERLQQKVTAMFANVLHDMFPCAVLTIYVTGLTNDVSVTNHTINNFFAATAPTEEPSSSRKEVSPNTTETKRHQKHTIKAFLASKPPLSCSTKEENVPTIHASSFFDQDDTTDLDLPNETSLPPYNTWICDRCQKPIQLEQVDEHTDYHFALDLDQDSTIMTQRDGKRTARQDAPAGAKKRPKHLFFTPI